MGAGTLTGSLSSGVGDGVSFGTTGAAVSPIGNTPGISMTGIDTSNPVSVGEYVGLNDGDRVGMPRPVNALTSIVGDKVRISGPSPTPSDPMLKGVGTGDDPSSCAVTVVCIIRSNIVDNSIIVICCECVLIFLYLLLFLCK